tara:strand:+ start:340 stop:531 length:192 start_codon:yes stop_codon:yes gene_type:complete
MMMKTYKVKIITKKSYDILASNSDEAREQAVIKFQQEFGKLSLYDVFNFLVDGSPYIEEIDDE